MEGAPHISCIGSTRDGIRDVLDQYRGHGIRHLVALRGDLPSGSADVGDFRYANELVRFIRDETSDWFHIDVAAYPEYHPQSRNPDDDIGSFRRKIDAGANSAITQYFFNADAYWSFVDACADRGITVPIVPGIMRQHRGARGVNLSLARPNRNGKRVSDPHQNAIRVVFRR